MLCVEVTHKVLRMDSVLYMIREAEQNCRGDKKDAVQRELKDTIVMTQYNRKTYHVDDVDYTQNPKNTFDYRGEQITFAKYYMDRYQVKVTDMNQPLLICRPTQKDIHRGEMRNTLLVPELCQMTGLSDGMRANFSLMRELAKHLHMVPAERLKTLGHFMTRLSENKEVSDINDRTLSYP
jgi:aubergine-like protein